MDKQRRRELQEQYKRMKEYMGVYQIRNTASGKVYLGASPNLKNQWFTIRAQLDAGRHMNAALQRDWNEQGPEAFEYEVLAQKECNDMEPVDKRWKLERMLTPLMEKLQPYGEKGYHKPPVK